MKRLLVILGIVVLASLLALPAVLGHIARQRIDTALAESLPEARPVWQAGWTRSSLQLEAAGWDARIALRHPPLPPDRWLALDGRLRVFEPAAAIDIDAGIALDGTLAMAASAAAITTRTPIEWSWQSPQINASITPAGRVRLAGRAERLGIRDGLGNRLVLEPVALTASSARIGDDLLRVRLEIRGQRPGAPGTRLALRLEPLAADPLATLFETLSALAGAEPGSARAGLAGIGAAGALGQLAEAGLVVRMPELVLDGDLKLQGAWNAAARTLTLQGGGPRAVVVDWWAALAGLQLALPVTDARQAAEAGLQRLARDGVLELDDGRIDVDIDTARSIVPAPAG